MDTLQGVLRASLDTPTAISEEQDMSDSPQNAPENGPGEPPCTLVLAGLHPQQGIGDDSKESAPAPQAGEHDDDNFSPGHTCKCIRESHIMCNI